MPFLPPPKPDVAHTAVAENSAVCGDACDATRNRFHRPDATQTHSSGTTEARCASHGASLAAETMLRRKSCVQPVFGLRSQGQQRAACFKARVVSMVWPLGGRRGSVGEGGGEDAISGSGWWIRLIKRGERGRMGAATNRGIHRQPRPTCLGLI